MAPLNILVIGSGIAGPALAYWLSRLPQPPTVTIVERTPDLRANGQQIDLRGQGIAVARLMGLEPAIRARAVDEAGLQLVDTKGRRKALLPVNKTGKGRQSFTSEFEIMRGDLVRILYDATKDKAKYIFGVHVEELAQVQVPVEDKDGQRTRDAVDVTFSDGTKETYDLVVGADGQNSRTRRTMIDRDAQGDHDSFHFLGIYAAYFTIPQQPTDSPYATVCHYPQARTLATRMGNPKTIQVYLGVRADHPLGPKLEEAHTKPTTSTKSQSQSQSQSQTNTADQPSHSDDTPSDDHLRQVWADIFRDAGWESNRAIDAMLHSPLAKDFYSQQIGQVRSPRWWRGRVVLLGDAAHCPSPMTGMGTSLALVGAYVLAGELARKMTAAVPAGGVAGVDVEGALAGYEDALRPYVDEGQKLMAGVPRLVYPWTRFGIWVLHAFAAVMITLRINKLLQMLRSDEVGRWRLPRYGELGVEKE